MMITLSESIDIDRTTDQIWAVIADYRRDSAWRTGVMSMEPSPPGPVDVGTTTAEHMRLAGRTWQNDGVVTAVVPGRSFAWRTTRGADANGSRSVVGIDHASCRVTLDLDVRPHGAERLLAPLVRRLLARNLRRDLRRLRHLVESAHETTAVAGAARS
jgi:uncharacterized membrane protein